MLIVPIFQSLMQLLRGGLKGRITLGPAQSVSHHAPLTLACFILCPSIALLRPLTTYPPTLSGCTHAIMCETTAGMLGFRYAKGGGGGVAALTVAAYTVAEVAQIASDAAAANAD